LNRFAKANKGRFDYSLHLEGRQSFTYSTPQEMFKKQIAGSASLRRAADNLAKYVEIEERDFEDQEIDFDVFEDEDE
jgi:hypothetical protein